MGIGSSLFTLFVLAAVAEAKENQRDVDLNASNRFGFHLQLRQLTSFTFCIWNRNYLGCIFTLSPLRE